MHSDCTTALERAPSPPSKPGRERLGRFRSLFQRLMPRKFGLLAGDCAPRKVRVPARDRNFPAVKLRAPERADVALAHWPRPARDLRAGLAITTCPRESGGPISICGLGRDIVRAASRERICGAFFAGLRCDDPGLFPFLIDLDSSSATAEGGGLFLFPCHEARFPPQITENTTWLRRSNQPLTHLRRRERGRTVADNFVPEIHPAQGRAGFAPCSASRDMGCRHAGPAISAVAGRAGNREENITAGPCDLDLAEIRVGGRAQVLVERRHRHIVAVLRSSRVRTSIPRCSDDQASVKFGAN